MKTVNAKEVLVSGASMAGLSAAYWMNKLGYKVTVVEIASQPRTAGAAVDIKGPAADAAKRMGIYEEMLSHRLHLELIEFKNTDDVTQSAVSLLQEGDAALPPDDDIEIERDQFVNILFGKLKNEVEFIFNNSIATLHETKENIEVTFRDGSRKKYELVLGCDGVHSAVRKNWFGDETDYSHFLGAYFSNTIATWLLVPQRSMQMYNVPNKGVMLNAYNNKTDIIFCFNSEKEIPYDFRNQEQQKKIILEQFEGIGWRTAELLEEVTSSNNFYFDKFCQVKMPSWTKGRVALIGDAGYCASPAAGMGASLAVYGATALADALQKHNGNFESAFDDYNKNLRPFIEKVQATAEFNLRNNFIIATEEAIRKRNTEPSPFWL
jgi:2-polyprenyl-6-methoxyphenol hydroxylase-like FAD-dependent oxidoreductase